MLHFKIKSKIQNYLQKKNQFYKGKKRETWLALKLKTSTIFLSNFENFLMLPHVTMVELLWGPPTFTQLRVTRCIPQMMLCMIPLLYHFYKEFGTQ